MSKTSAGLLMYRIKNSQLQIFLVHPGGPFWKNKDEGFWSIPKGEIDGEESAFKAAQREVKEETGIIPPENENTYIDLGEVKTKIRQNSKSLGIPRRLAWLANNFKLRNNRISLQIRKIHKNPRSG